MMSPFLKDSVCEKPERTRRMAIVIRNDFFICVFLNGMYKYNAKTRLYDIHSIIIYAQYQNFSL